jgi:hypothetical protein
VFVVTSRITDNILRATVQAGEEKWWPKYQQLQNCFVTACAPATLWLRVVKAYLEK